MGRGDFYDGMPGWTYFSQAMPGHPASIHIKQKYLSVCLSVCPSCLAMTSLMTSLMIINDVTHNQSRDDVKYVT